MLVPKTIIFKGGLIMGRTKQKNQITEAFDSKAIGQRIQELRKSYGETQEDLNNFLGYANTSSISQMETGTYISLDSLCRVAKHYHVSYDYLIEGKGSSYLFNILSEYINLEYEEVPLPDIDTNTHNIPIIKINTMLYNALQNIAYANSIKALPEDLKNSWIDTLKEDLNKAVIDPAKRSNFSSFIAVNQNFLLGEDIDTHRAILKILDFCEATSPSN